MHYVNYIRKNNNFFLFLGIFTCTRDISSVYFILSIHSWFCLVCTLTCKEILYETILFVCMDTCCTTYSSDTKLSYNTKYFPRTYMVNLLFTIIIKCFFINDSVLKYLFIFLYIHLGLSYQ